MTCSAGGAGNVYSWTDDAGVTHFSETPPEEDGIESTVREIPPAPAVRPPVPDDYYSVATQAARMEARRLEQERLRAEILRAESEARRAEAEAEAARREQAATEARETTHYLPLYPWNPYGHHARPFQRPPPHYPPPGPYPPPKRNKRLVVEPEHR
jgi:hypothetical protein